MRLLKMALLVAMLGISMPVIAACDNDDGAFEELGEDIDEAAEEVEDEIDDATDER